MFVEPTSRTQEVLAVLPMSRLVCAAAVAVNLLVAALLMLLLLLALNGYQIAHAGWSIGMFGVLATCVAVACGYLAERFARWLVQTRKWAAWWATMGSTIVGVIAATLFNLLLLLMAVFLSEQLRLAAALDAGGPLARTPRESSVPAESSFDETVVGRHALHLVRYKAHRHHG